MTGSSITLSNLKDVPSFCEVVADRVWQAWWKDKGFPLEYIAGLVNANLESAGVPFCLIAHRGDTFIGTASVIACDMDERPQYSPWIAAVWVDPEYRSLGAGSMLTEKAVAGSFVLGFSEVFLCATPDNEPFYTRQGWQRVEEGIGQKHLNILRRKRTD